MNRRLVTGGIVIMVLAGSMVAALWGGRKPVEVQYEIAENRPLRASVLGSGTFDFRDTAALSPEVIGLVRQVLVKEGDHVQIGQLVMVLDQETQKAEVQQRESMVRQRALDIEQQAELLDIRQTQERRSTELVAKRLVDQASHDQVRHEVALARLRLKASREQLKQSMAALVQVRESLAKTLIRAPISGVVTSIALKVGETAVPSSTGIAGSSLMTIADVGTMAATIKVDEMDVSRIRQGQQAQVFAGSDSRRVLSGRVQEIALAPMRTGLESTSAHQRSYAVQIALDGHAHADLRTGMSCRAEVFVDVGRTPVAVPVQALLSEQADGARHRGAAGKAAQQRYYLLVESGGAVVRRHVESGVSDDSHVEIVSGLARGDRVITGPAKTMRHLRDNQRVRAVPAMLELP
ncbi:efflux RND transporter periplasmic adaptor subunit [Stenotrophomonas sp. Sa5BUN4]|uniref:Efflux RND transporter periplasmic adaptor subunit n=1 Tax=Stenotrophomonas lacuserhaii TaxID=2760084 RepID=A0A8X8K3E3_9GAMM|nr:efflux RND transporter periplasmic adaptor subunit [Stenotrophomonas pennii]MBD7954940.1 efflux RND transporter periplasmic adaptor subunit [Stenotrophomonas pennii]